jgi:hypothetical protein
MKYNQNDEVKEDEMGTHVSQRGTILAGKPEGKSPLQRPKMLVGK